MLKHCSTIAGLVLAVASQAAEPIAAPGKITAVTVYPDRAQVTRTVEVDVPAGECRIAVPLLPVALQDDSVRAAGSAAMTVSIQDLEVRQVVGEKILDEEAARLEKRLRELRDARAALEGRQRVLDQQASVFQQIQIKATGDLNREIQVNKFDLEQLKGLPGFVAAQVAQLEENRQKLEIERRELEHTIRAAEAEFNKRRVAASRTSKTVLVSLNATAPAQARLQVSYVVPNASWAPVYDARAVADKGQVALTYGAIVRQRTGEDWAGVNLTLSTAKPAIGASLPELGKWVVNFFEPRPMVATMKSSPGMTRMAAGEMAGRESDSGLGLAEVEMTVPTATVEQGVTATVFRVPRAADVPADGEGHRQTVLVATLPATFSYETTPKLTPFAYLKAVTTNVTDAPFLAGPVQVFVGPDFIGTGRLETTAPTEGLTLSMGIDEGIRVKREELKDRRGKAGIFNKRKRQTYAYKITVENFKDRVQRVVVADQIPVTANEEIKVALGETVPKPDKVEEASGKLSWELLLKPREKRELVYEFTVEWPQDRAVSGL
ncbi:MAG: hypothetical protein PCFJNLEI_01342 [Verrucomicrobiae bacterium]|nr:hypothetical protein [Verrucomicrobiae bacterium]